MSEEKKTQDNGNVMTRSKAFKVLVDKTFESMDIANKGEIDKVELYAGLLMIHLKIAKYAGPAACYPPTREVCDKLFMAADKDNSGGIDKQEFVKIMGITCAQILSRMLMYYLVLILFVPYFAAKVVDIMEIQNGSYSEMATEQIISQALFFAAIPFLWDKIDEASQKELARDDKNE